MANVKEWAVHSVARAISVICVLLVMGGLVWCIYVTVVRPITKPNPTTTQAARIIQNIEVNNPEDTFFIGIKVFGWKLGLSKPTIKTTRQVIKEATK